MTQILLPTQQAVLDNLFDQWSHWNVFLLSAWQGRGKTTLLHEIQRQKGGILLSLRDLPERMKSRHPLAFEETFAEWVEGTLAVTDLLLLDDLCMLTGLVNGHYYYPRKDYFDLVLARLVTRVIESGKKLVVASEGCVPAYVGHRARSFGFPDLTPEDFDTFIRCYLGDERAAGLDFPRIHRFAPAINLHHLRGASQVLSRWESVDTEGFIRYLQEQHLTSNVDLGEVQKIDLRDLHGIADVIEALEGNVVLPLENDDLAQELGLKPKRGVLLLGPPGTGKTTVGRALAHRLRGKFFLIDGTVISGTDNFYWKVDHIFEQAKQNAPAVIFIDDSDVIFESGSELGLYRYLLTMLDGLESTSNARVCVMLTAMDVSALPPALLRSGRVELWLEMQLPDQDARLAILRHHLLPLPQAMEGLNLERLAEETAGFTGADLKRVSEDGRLLLAHDRVRERPLRATLDYFLSAVTTLRANKARYAQAGLHAREQRPQRPVYFDVHNGEL